MGPIRAYGAHRAHALGRQAAGRWPAAGGGERRRHDGGGRAISESALKLKTTLNYERWSNDQKCIPCMCLYLQVCGVVAFGLKCLYNSWRGFCLGMNMLGLYLREEGLVIIGLGSSLLLHSHTPSHSLFSI